MSPFDRAVCDFIVKLPCTGTSVESYARLPGENKRFNFYRMMRETTRTT